MNVCLQALRAQAANAVKPETVNGHAGTPFKLEPAAANDEAKLDGAACPAAAAGTLRPALSVGRLDNGAGAGAAGKAGKGTAGATGELTEWQGKCRVLKSQARHLGGQLDAERLRVAEVSSKLAERAGGDGAPALAAERGAA